MGKHCVVVVEDVCWVAPLFFGGGGGDTQQSCWQIHKRLHV